MNNADLEYLKIQKKPMLCEQNIGFFHTILYFLKRWLINRT